MTPVNTHTTSVCLLFVVPGEGEESAEGVGVGGGVCAPDGCSPSFPASFSLVPIIQCKSFTFLMRALEGEVCFLAPSCLSLAAAERGEEGAEDCETSMDGLPCAFSDCTCRSADADPPGRLDAREKTARGRQRGGES